MSISYKIYDSFENLDITAWETVNKNSIANDSLGMEPGFLLSIENSMSQYSRFWYVIFYSDTGAPISSACLSTLSVDLTILSSGILQRVISFVRSVLPSFLYMKILFCGTPASLGQIGVQFTSEAKPEYVLKELDSILTTLAEETKSRVIVHKECESKDLDKMDSLYEIGYRRADSLDMHVFTEKFESFSDYLSGLNSHYRYDIKRSLKKLEKNGVEIKRYTNSDDICRKYTNDLYEMYLAVVSRSETQLEILPRAFFIEMSNRYSDEIGLTLLEKDGKVLAYNWSLNHDGKYHFLFCGIDYDNNKKYDLYFNVMYAELGFALDAKADDIYVGQTASGFKMRLGCKQEPLYLFVRSHGYLFKGLLSMLFKYLFPPNSSVTVPAIFNSSYKTGLNQ